MSDYTNNEGVDPSWGATESGIAQIIDINTQVDFEIDTSSHPAYERDEPSKFAPGDKGPGSNKFFDKHLE